MEYFVFFEKKGMRVLGVDPMLGISQKAKKNGVKDFGDFFNRNEAKKLKKIMDMQKLLHQII